MPPKLYATGYGGRTLDVIRQLVDDLDAYLIDIRFVPYSGNPAFRRAELAATFGARYLYLHAFGNRNYKSGGPVDLVDYPAGRDRLAELDRPAILLCGCQDATHCHRTTIVKHLIADGFDASEWDDGSPRQLPLF